MIFSLRPDEGFLIENCTLEAAQALRSASAAAILQGGFHLENLSGYVSERCAGSDFYQCSALQCGISLAMGFTTVVSAYRERYSIFILTTLLHQLNFFA